MYVFFFFLILFTSCKQSIHYVNSFCLYDEDCVVALLFQPHQNRPDIKKVKNKMKCFYCHLVDLGSKWQTVGKSRCHIHRPSMLSFLYQFWSQSWTQIPEKHTSSTLISTTPIGDLTLCLVLCLQTFIKIRLYLFLLCACHAHNRYSVYNT